MFSKKKLILEVLIASMIADSPDDLTGSEYDSVNMIPKATVSVPKKTFCFANPVKRRNPSNWIFKPIELLGRRCGKFA